MSKYIDVKVILQKTIKIDNDNLEIALENAKDQFQDLELTDEWLNAREVTFKENTIINSSAEKLAELYHNDFNKNSLKELLNLVFDDYDIIDNIYNEAINILKSKYHLNDIDIHI